MENTNDAASDLTVNSSPPAIILTQEISSTPAESSNPVIPLTQDIASPQANPSTPEIVSNQLVPSAQEISSTIEISSNAAIPLTTATSLSQAIVSAQGIPSTSEIYSNPAIPSAQEISSTPEISPTPLTSQDSASPSAPESVSNSNKYVWVDTPELMTKAIKEIERHRKVALVCEGLKVSRSGAVDIVCVGIQNGKMFMFDITDHGTWLDAGLRDLLECGSEPVLGRGDKVKDKFDKMKRMCERRLSNDSLPEVKSSKVKLMFDCRNDADALLHRHNVRLDGVLDLQLLEIVHRRKIRLNHELLRDMEECLETYANDIQNKISKHRGMDLFEEASRTGRNPWTVRPLSPELIDSLAADVNSLFALNDVLRRNKSVEQMSLVLESSKRYADYFRSYKTFPKDVFYRNAYVPHNILIWIPREAHDPPRSCEACLKVFGMSELSCSVIPGSPLCALCIKIIRQIKYRTGEFPQIKAENHVEHSSTRRHSTALPRTTSKSSIETADLVLPRRQSVSQVVVSSGSTEGFVSPSVITGYQNEDCSEMTEGYTETTM